MVIIFWSNIEQFHFGESGGGNQCRVWEQSGFFDGDREACKLHAELFFLFIVVLVGWNPSNGEVLASSQGEPSAA